MFRELLANQRNEPGAGQRAAAMLGPTVQNAGIRFVEDLSHFQARPDCLLIGVAVWSMYDLDLLDAVAKRVIDYRFCEHELFVFNAGGEWDLNELERLAPGILPVFHTPMVVQWDASDISFRGNGYFAREHIRSMLA